MLNGSWDLNLAGREASHQDDSRDYRRRDAGYRDEPVERNDSRHADRCDRRGGDKRRL